MKTEPSIDKVKLCEQISSVYSLEVADMTFLPKGETAWGYVVGTNKGAFFLKIYPKVIPYLEEASELTAKLFYDCGITEVVQALRDDTSKTVQIFEPYPFVLFRYIQGKEVSEQKLTDIQVEEMGCIIGRIHAATSRIGMYPKKEIFISKDKNMFLKVLQRITAHEKNENVYQKEHVDLLMPKKERIMQELTALEELGTKLQNANLPLVICHSDPTQGNILIGNDGRLYLIDWDNPILAPKERDLVFFQDRMLPFMKGYSSVIGETQMNNDMKRFYEYEWNVQEIADFGERILFQHNSSEQNHHDLTRTKEFLIEAGIEVQ